MLDFIIAGYPKSGNNWITHLLQYNLQGSSYNPDHRNTAIYRTENIVDRPEKAVYMLRHPLDIILSYRNYEIITNKVIYKDFDTYFDSFLKCEGIRRGRGWNSHVEYWTTKNNILIVEYDKLDINLLKKVYEFCNLPTNIADEAYKAMSFENLKKREREKIENNEFAYFKRNWSRPNIKALKSGKGFFNRGESFYFKDQLTKDQIQRGYKTFKQNIDKYWPDEDYYCN